VTTETEVIGIETGFSVGSAVGGISSGNWLGAVGGSFDRKVQKMINTSENSLAIDKNEFEQFYRALENMFLISKSNKYQNKTTVSYSYDKLSMISQNTPLKYGNDGSLIGRESDFRLIIGQAFFRLDDNQFKEFIRMILKPVRDSKDW